MFVLTKSVGRVGRFSLGFAVNESRRGRGLGKEIVVQDIEACRQLAEAAGAEEGSGKAGRVATGTAVGAGVGAASGAVWGLLTGLFYTVGGSSQPNQAYSNFVNRCLQEKGYEVTGWQ